MGTSSARMKVLESALELFNQYGCDGTSIKMIIDESGVSNGGVYHHFKTKENIIYDLYNKVKRDMLEYMLQNIDESTSTRELFQNVWKLQIEWSLENWNAKKFMDYISYSHLVKKLHDDEMVEKFDSVFCKLFKAMEQGEIIKMNRKYFGYDYMGNVGAVINYIKHHPEANTEEFINFTFKKYWRSIVNI